jgi:retron-type reverse transcriptase
MAVLLPQDELLGLIRSAPHRYKVYQIEKRKAGQFRTIAQPAKEVKALQYWVMKHVLSEFEVHPAATGYRDGRSIAHNARPHARSRFLLKLDFKDFFPSLKARDFKLFLRRTKATLDKETVEALCRILFWRPKGTQDLRLSIGAPTSPMLSNILMLDFDRRVSKICAASEVTYTRYADDLTFSANSSDRLEVVENAVVDLCSRLKSPFLTINQEKTVRVSKRDTRRVTGLVLTNDRKVSLGRDEKRRIRAWVHHFVTNRLDADQIPKLRGMLNYVNSVEPAFMRRLREKYGAEAITRLQTGH